jgi:hypothetical protein
MSQSNPIEATPTLVSDRAAAAFAAMAAEIRAVPEAELLPVTLDVLTVITTVLGALPELRAVRAQITATWRDFNLDQFDKLEQYTLALNHAQGVYKASSAPKTAVAELAQALTVQRDQLLANAESLAAFDLIDGERLKHVKTAPGYRPLAGDIFALATIYQDHWSAVEGRTPVTLAALTEAKESALELLEAVGLRDQTPLTLGEAALVRQQAFTLLVRTYEQARKAVVYLRGDEGANEVAPSLYALRGSRRRAADEEAVESAEGAEKDAKATNGKDGAEPPSFKLDNPDNLPITHPFVQ